MKGGGNEPLKSNFFSYIKWPEFWHATWMTMERHIHRCRTKHIDFIVSLRHSYCGVIS